MDFVEKAERIYCEDCSFWCNDYERCGCYFLQHTPKCRMKIRLDYTERNRKNDCKYFEKAKRGILGSKKQEKSRHIKELDI